MLENVSPRLMREGLPHANAPDKVLRFVCAPWRKQASSPSLLRREFFIGIGAKPWKSASTRSSRFERFTKVRAHSGIIIQNFRAKPDIPMAAYPEPSLEDMLRTIALARLSSAANERPGPSNLSYNDFPRLLDAASTTGAHFSRHQGFHQSRSRLAANLPPPIRNRITRLHLAGTSRAVSGICRP